MELNEPLEVKITRENARILYERCPLCGATNFAAFRQSDCTYHDLYRAELPPTITWCHCQNCGHVFTDGYFTDEMVKLISSKSHENQDVGYDTENQRYVSARMIERVTPYIDNGSWLDVGFGNGSLLFTAEEYGYRPVGIDLRQANVDALKRFNIEAHCSDIATLDHPRRYSVISMADVLEHMPFPKQGLEAAWRLLHNDGVILVSMPNIDAPMWQQIDDAKVNPYWGEIEHYHNFGRESLYRTLEETGFKPLRYGVSERYRICMEVVARKVNI